MDTLPALAARNVMTPTFVRSILIFFCATGVAFAQDAPVAPDLATTPATAVAAGAGKLYVGSIGGDLNVYDSVTGKGLESIHGQTGPVSLVSSSSAGLAWVVGGRPAGIRDRTGVASAPSEQTLFVRPAGSATATSIDLRPAGVNSPVHALAWIGDHLAIIEDFNTTFFDAKAHAIVLPESFMPKAVADSLTGTHLWASTLADGTSVVVIAKPHSVRRNPLSTGLPYVSVFDAYKVKGTTWTKLGGFASNAFDISPADSVVADEDGKILPTAHFGIVSETVGVDDKGVVALEGSSLLTVPITSAGWESSREPIAVRWSDGELPPDSLWFGVSPSTAWWWDGNALMAQDRKGGQSVAYLPWNDPEAAVRGFATDGDGLWIATTVGVRRLDPKHADPVLGFGGFIRASLGKDAGRAATVEQKAIEQALWKWRLAPADEAGQDGGAMISGVFATLGVTLPKKSSDLGSAKAGLPVRDELQFGDVLIFRRGAAIYLGDGKTAELQRGFVRNSTIWPRSTAVVRRFATAPKQ